jgi:hypothetical protein
MAFSQYEELIVDKMTSPEASDFENLRRIKRHRKRSRASSAIFSQRFGHLGSFSKAHKLSWGASRGF